MYHLLPEATKRKQKKRRRSTDLSEHEKWMCPYGCGKFYRNTSTRSIHKHVLECTLRTESTPDNIPAHLLGRNRGLLAVGPVLDNDSSGLITLVPQYNPVAGGTPGMSNGASSSSFLAGSPSFPSFMPNQTPGLAPMTGVSSSAMFAQGSQSMPAFPAQGNSHMASGATMQATDSSNTGSNLWRCQCGFAVDQTNMRVIRQHLSECALISQIRAQAQHNNETGTLHAPTTVGTQSALMQQQQQQHLAQQLLQSYSASPASGQPPAPPSFPPLASSSFSYPQPDSSESYSLAGSGSDGLRPLSPLSFLGPDPTSPRPGGFLSAAPDSPLASDLGRNQSLGYLSPLAPAPAMFPESDGHDSQAQLQRTQSENQAQQPSRPDYKHYRDPEQNMSAICPVTGLPAIHPHMHRGHSPNSDGDAASHRSGSSHGSPGGLETNASHGSRSPSPNHGHPIKSAFATQLTQPQEDKSERMQLEVKLLIKHMKEVDELEHRAEPPAPLEDIMPFMDKACVDTLAATWPVITRDPTKAGFLYYKRLFELEQAVKPHFSGIDMYLQAHLIMDMLTKAVNLLTSSPNCSLALIKGSGRRHAKYKVPVAYYALFKPALVYTMREMIQEKYTDKVHQAMVWFADLITRMIVAGHVESFSSCGAIKEILLNQEKQLVAKDAEIQELRRQLENLSTSGSTV